MHISTDSTDAEDCNLYLHGCDAKVAHEQNFENQEENEYIPTRPHLRNKIRFNVKIARIHLNVSTA